MRGEEPHPQYYEQPELSQEYDAFIAAWNELSTERPIGMVEGNIPHSKIREYGRDELALDGEELDFFVRVMRRVDDGYLSGGGINADPKVVDQVSPNDVKGVRKLLARLGAKPGQGDRWKKPIKKPEPEA